MIVASVLSFSTLGIASPKSQTVTVVIENMKFSPAELEVKKGETVIWVNKDLVPHTATADDGSFDSKMIGPGKSWKYQPKKAGTYSYKCTFHPTMLGSITVK